MTTKNFPTQHIVGAYTGILMPGGEEPFSEMCQMLCHLTGQNLTVIQIASEQDRYAAALLRQHPFLAEVRRPELVGDGVPLDALHRWHNQLITQHGKTLPVTTDPDYTRLNPIDGIPDEALKKVWVVGGKDS